MKQINPSLRWFYQSSLTQQQEKKLRYLLNQQLGDNSSSYFTSSQISRQLSYCEICSSLFWSCYCSFCVDLTLAFGLLMAVCASRQVVGPYGRIHLPLSQRSMNSSVIYYLVSVYHSLFSNTLNIWFVNVFRTCYCFKLMYNFCIIKMYVFLGTFLMGIGNW